MRKEQVVTREFEGMKIKALEGEGNERKFELSFSSEEPYERYCYTEILDHADGAVDLTRLNSIGVLLYNHDRNKVIGKILKAWIENTKGYAEIELDKDAESEVIYQKIKNGTLKAVSVGYRVDSWEEVMVNKTSADGRFKGPVDIARKWTPYEVSIVSIPADPTVGIGRALEEKDNLNIYENQIKINQWR